MSKYFFISAEVVKYTPIPDIQLDEESIKELETQNHIKIINKIPHAAIKFVENYTIQSDSGMFVPSAVIDYLCIQHKLSSCAILYVRDISYEEFEAERNFVKKQTSPKPIENSIMNEIEDLISKTETGNLNVYKPERPDVPKNKTEKNLRELGLPENLFDDPFTE